RRGRDRAPGSPPRARHRHAVAAAPHRLDPAGPQPGPELRDVLVDGALGADEVDAPHPVEELAAREDAADVSGEERQELAFARRELEPPAAQPHLAAVVVELQFAEHAGRTEADAPEQRAQAR